MTLRHIKLYVFYSRARDSTERVWPVLLASNRTGNIHLYIWRTSHSSTSGLASINDVHQMIWLVQQQQCHQSGLCIHPFHITPSHLKEIGLANIVEMVSTELQVPLSPVEMRCFFFLVCWHLFQWMGGGGSGHFKFYSNFVIQLLR